MRLKINIGDRFGELVVIKELPTVKIPSGQINRIFLMRCDCGNERPVRLLHFIRGRIKNCGHNRHGETGKPLHTIWRGMVNRCRETYGQNYYYSDKGITLYPGWKKYINFRDWAVKNNYKEGLTIDRINNSEGYYPHNCRFVTQAENNLNRDNTFFVIYKGKKIPLLALLKEKNKDDHFGVIYSRIKRGWTVEDAVDKPIRTGNYLTREKLKKLLKRKI
ncbi:MAG: hypothetical protein ACYDBV_11225 [Nitrospiria bacterium]